MPDAPLSTGGGDALFQVLVHGTDALQRRSIARVLATHGVVARLSSTLAEAAKCLADHQVAVAVLLDSATVMPALHDLHPRLTLLWAGAAAPPAGGDASYVPLPLDECRPDIDAIALATLRLLRHQTAAGDTTAFLP